MVKTLVKYSAEETPSGILKTGDTDYAPAAHADRLGEVIAVPKGMLPFSIKGDIMPWETVVEISPGMIVWYDYLANLNADGFIDEEGYEYKVIDYDNLYVATVPRDEEGDPEGLQVGETGMEYIIPLNGFHLFERVLHEKKHRFDITENKVDPRYGIVKYVARNNTAYENGTSVDHFDLQVGDKVMFGNVPEVMLEDDLHCHFDGGRMYRRSQSRNIELVWRGDKLILPKGSILIKRKPDEEISKGGIILLKANVKNHTGEVVLSSNDQVPIGSEILYIKGTGWEIDYQGEKHRVLTNNQILYVN